MIFPPEFAQAEEARRRRLLNRLENGNEISVKNSGIFVTYSEPVRFRRSEFDQMESDRRK